MIMMKKRTVASDQSMWLCADVLKEAWRTRQSRGSICRVVCLLLAMVAGSVPICGCKRASEVPEVGPGFHAVLLDNGQAYFGKLTRLNTQYVRLTDVYYVQRRVDAKTGEVQASTLVKRGREWHAPDHMIVNTAHIVFIENVKADSDVLKAIKEIESK